MGFEVSLVPRGNMKSVFQYEIRRAKALVDIALAPGQPREPVRHVGCEQILGAAFIGGHIRMQSRRTGLHRFEGIEHRRQLLVLHFDQAQGFFGRIDGLRGHRSDAVADETHRVPAQHGHVADLFADIESASVRTCDDGLNAWHPAGFRGI